jgi:hypothetical protein
MYPEWGKKERNHSSDYVKKKRCVFSEISESRSNFELGKFRIQEQLRNSIHHNTALSVVHVSFVLVQALNLYFRTVYKKRIFKHIPREIHPKKGRELQVSSLHASLTNEVAYATS